MCPFRTDVSDKVYRVCHTRESRGSRSIVMTTKTSTVLIFQMCLWQNIGIILSFVWQEIEKTDKSLRFIGLFQSSDDSLSSASGCIEVDFPKRVYCILLQTVNDMEIPFGHFERCMTEKTRYRLDVGSTVQDIHSGTMPRAVP